MNDLSMHIIDIVQNSLSAGASRVCLTVDEDPGADRLTIVVADDGKGMTAEQVRRLADPFFTSRTTRRVGMGIPLLMQSARQSGGDVRISSEPGKGTEVTAEFGYSDLARPPLGDLANALMLMVSANPDRDFLFTYRYAGREYAFDTADVREVFGNGALEDLTLIRNLEKMIKDNMCVVRDS